MIDGDELAGIVDQFGALTPDELDRAVEEVAFRAGETVDEAALAAAVEEAERRLRLVAVDRDDGRLYVAGPGALPRLPTGGENLPHVLDVSERSVERAAVVEAAEGRLREAAARAVGAGDRERVELLLDATYDLEAWAPEADASGVRERLDDVLAEIEE
ncbi:MAG: hypothetical protein ABEJ43_07210 [Haloferacaceae archaeon]